MESFVSKLQKSAEAARVLEHRERGRRTRRREAGGEGHPRVGSRIPHPGYSQITSLPLGSPFAPLASWTPSHDLTESLPLSLTLSPYPITLLVPLPKEGLLTLRAKPPNEAEYTDVLQKIKYAFSLLVRTRRARGIEGTGWRT